MAKVIVTADSTCDLSPELVSEYGVVLAPLWVAMGDNNYHDGVDIFPKDIYAHVAQTKKLPKTAAVSVGEYSELFSKYTQQGAEVVHVSISSHFSSTGRNACIAAEEVGNVYVVDSYNLSTGSGHIVLEAAILAAEGKLSAKEIAEQVQQFVARVDASFVIDAVDYLYKGGRCSGVAALGANLLKIKPCIEVRDGKMEMAKKYRGKMQDVIRAYVQDRLSQPGVSYKRDRVFITHTCVTPGLVDAAREVVEQSGLFDRILETTAGCTVTSHCGPDTLGVLFIRQ